MIKNDKQYQVTKSRLNDFRESLLTLEKDDTDPLLNELHCGAIKSQITEFEKAITEYELLKEGKQYGVFVDNLSLIYEPLIKARIANGWTQANLAKKLNLKEQQIQRYETSDYSTASIDRIVEVAAALGIQFEKIKVKVKEPEFLLSEEVKEKLSLFRMKNKRRTLIA